MLKVNDYVKKYYDKKIPSHEDVLSLVFKVKKEQKNQVISEGVDFYDEGIISFLKKAAEKIKTGLQNIENNYTAEMQKLDATTTTKQLIAITLFGSPYSNKDVARVVDDLFKRYPKETSAAVTKIQELKAKPETLKDPKATAAILKSAITPIDNIITLNDPAKLAKILAQGTPDEAEVEKEAEQENPEEASTQKQTKLKAKSSQQAIKNEPHIQNVLSRIENLIESADAGSDVIGAVSGAIAPSAIEGIIRKIDPNANFKDAKKPNYSPAKNYNVILVKNVAIQTQQPQQPQQ